MTVSASVISAYGEEVNCGSLSFKGFLSPIEPRNAENKHIPCPAGVANEARYLLITAKNVDEGETVCARSESFEVLRTEPIYFAGGVSHYECVLRPKGRINNV